jgi:hypothetical protein
MKSFANTKLNAAWGGLLVVVGVIWVRWLAIQTA